MISFKQTKSIIEVLHFKTPLLGFSFLLPLSFEIIQCKFFQSNFHFLLSTDRWNPTILV